MKYKNNYDILLKKILKQERDILHIKFLSQTLKDAIKGNESIIHLSPLTSIITNDIEQLYDNNQAIYAMCIKAKN